MQTRLIAQAVRRQAGLRHRRGHTESTSVNQPERVRVRFNSLPRPGSGKKPDAHALRLTGPGAVWLLCLLVLIPTVSAEDWPRFGGPRGNNTWQGPKLAAEFPDGGLKINWRQPVGGGFGGISATGESVLVMDRQTQPTEVERVLCLDAATGKSLWTFETPVTYGKLDYGNGPRATPTIADGRVYTLGAVGHLACLDLVTGRAVWRHDLQQDFGAKIPEWGLAGSPLVFEQLVIVHPGVKSGGCLMAFDRATGKEVWRSGTDPAGYATPILVERPGGVLLVAWTPEHILGIEPRTGKQLWQIPYKVTYGVSIATPIFHGDTILVAGYWEGSRAITLGANLADAKLQWSENKFLRGLMSQPLERDGVVYLLDKQYGLTAFELATGNKLWDDNNRLTARGRNPHVSLTWLGEKNRAIMLNAEGDLILARLSAQGCAEDSRTHLINPTDRSPIWAHPAFAGEFVFARSDKEIIAARLPLAPSE